MFLKDSPMESANSFSNEGGAQGDTCKNIFLADLVEVQHLFEALETSLTFKSSENDVKVDAPENVCDGERQFFFRMKER